MVPPIELPSRALIQRRVQTSLAPGRCVTVVGPGGMGKTWLARRLTGTRFVECVDANSTADLVRVLAEAVGSRGPTGTDQLEALAEVVAHDPRWLVLDNLEQMVDGARPVVEALLTAGVGVVCTSRAPLGLARERVVRLQPLGEAEALRFFRAFADPVTTEPREQAVALATLVELTGGNPLVLEITAGHTRLGTPQQLVERLEREGDLNDVDGRRLRHRSLAEVGEQTWALITDAQRIALSRLACLPRPWTVDEARQLGVRVREVEELRRWSLVQRAEVTPVVTLQVPTVVRLWLRVAHPPSERDRRVVGDWVTERAESLTATFGRAGGAEAKTQLAALHPLFEMVVADQTQPVSLRSTCLVAVCRYLGGTDQAQVLRWLQTHADVVPEEEHQRLQLVVLRARALRRLGRQAEGLAAVDEALAGSWSPLCVGELRIERSLQLAHARQGAPCDEDAALAVELLDGSGTRAEALAHRQLGVAHRLMHRQEAARDSLMRAVELSRTGGWLVNEVTAISQLIQLDQVVDTEAAAALYQQGAAAVRRLGDTGVRAVLDGQYASRMLWEGQVDRAMEVVPDAIETFEQIGLRSAADNLRCRMALARAPGQSIEACRSELTRLLGESRRSQVSHYEGDLLCALAALSHLEDDLDSAIAAYERAVRRADELGQAGAQGLGRELLSLATGKPLEEAASHAGRCPGYLRQLRGAVVERVRGADAGWSFQRDGGAFLTPDAERVGLGRRQASRRILVTLVEARVESPGQSLSTGALFEHGWPGQKIRHSSAQARLWTAIRDLRSLGLDALLQTSGDGYRLDPSVPVQVVDALPEG